MSWYGAKEHVKIIKKYTEVSKMKVIQKEITVKELNCSCCLGGGGGGTGQ